MLIDSMRVLHFSQLKIRGLSVKNLYHLKAYVEYYPNIHSAPFNPTSANFCIVANLWAHEIFF